LIFNKSTLSYNEKGVNYESTKRYNNEMSTVIMDGGRNNSIGMTMQPTQEVGVPGPVFGDHHSIEDEEDLYDTDTHPIDRGVLTG
jgi:hypothetical protein